MSPHFLVLRPQFPQRSQPCIDNSKLLIRERGVHASAGGVAADDDVLDLEVLHGVEDYALGVDVGRGDDVGDVSVHKDIAGLQA